MKEIQVRASLFCIHCRDDTDHTIIYLNNKIIRATCDTCGKRMEQRIDITQEIYTEVIERLKSKPVRMTDELRDHLIDFLLSLPMRVTSKPYRIYREAKQLKGYYKKYKK